MLALAICSVNLYFKTTFPTLGLTIASLSYSGRPYLSFLRYNWDAPPPQGCLSVFWERPVSATAKYRAYVRYLVSYHTRSPETPHVTTILLRRNRAPLYPMHMTVHQRRPDQVSSSVLDRPAGAPTPSCLRERHAVIQTCMSLPRSKAPLVNILEEPLSPSPSAAAPACLVGMLGHAFSFNT